MGFDTLSFKVAGTAVLFMLLGAWAGSAASGPPEPPRQAVSDATLDALRGGVSTDSLTLSIGIARAVFINGEPVVTTTLNIPALNASGASMRAAITRQAGAAAAAATPVTRGSAATPVVVLGNQGMSIIQNGPGNAVTLQGLPSAGTIIQNTLDNQAIRSVTTIDAKVFSSALAQRLNLAASMNAALLRPAGR